MLVGTPKNVLGSLLDILHLGRVLVYVVSWRIFVRSQFPGMIKLHFVGSFLEQPNCSS